MSYEIIIRPEAELDIQEAYFWYEDHNPGLGLEFMRCLDACFDVIKENPQIFQSVYKDIRRALPQRFPYGVFYIIRENSVSVIAVLHSKRNPALLEERKEE